MVGSDDAALEKIEVLQDWNLKDSKRGRVNQSNTATKTNRMDNLMKVRSLISYTKPDNGEAQWGSDISDMAISIVNTKLELEPRDTLLDELDMTLHVLRGTHFLAFDKLPRDGADPEYPSKSPTEIVTDYLTKVYACAREALAGYKLNETKTPVDIVVTVPVVRKNPSPPFWIMLNLSQDWSYEATNSTFKAIRAAGFNETNFPTLKDTILVSEPEAASYFTAQDLHVSGVDFLEVSGPTNIEMKANIRDTPQNLS